MRETAVRIMLKMGDPEPISLEERDDLKSGR